MLSLCRPRRLWEILPASGSVVINNSNANEHNASETFDARHSDLRPSTYPIKHEPSSSKPVKPLTDLPVETLRDIVELVDQGDAICLALTSHHLRGIVLAVKGVSKLQDICPPRPTISQGSCMLVPWLGTKMEEEENDYEDEYGEYEILMSQLWSWMGPTYLYCGRENKDYIKRGSSRHVDGDILCSCGQSEWYRRRDVADAILNCPPVRRDELDGARVASEEARMEVDGYNQRVRKKLKKDRKERLATRQMGRLV